MPKKVKPKKLADRLARLKSPLPAHAKAWGHVTETEVRLTGRCQLVDVIEQLGRDGLVTISTHADGEVGLIYAETDNA